jgi:hypothetical protein
MDQPVFMDMNTYMKIISDDQMQQQQIQTQGMTMTGSEQSQQDVIVQEDQTQQHVIYSPMKTNEQGQQYGQDEPMQNHFLIRAPGQQGQYYYAMNQNRIPQMQQTQQINHNQSLIQQGQNQQEVSVKKVIFE